MGWRVYLIPGDVQIVEDPGIPPDRYEVVTEVLHEGGGGLAGAARDLGRTVIHDGQEHHGYRSYVDIPSNERRFYRCRYRCHAGVRAWSQSSNGLCSWDISFSPGYLPQVDPFEGPVNRRSVYRWPFYPDGRPDPLGNMPPQDGLQPTRSVRSTYTFEPDRPQE